MSRGRSQPATGRKGATPIENSRTMFRLAAGPSPVLPSGPRHLAVAAAAAAAPIAPTTSPPPAKYPSSMIPRLAFPVSMGTGTSLMYLAMCSLPVQPLAQALATAEARWRRTALTLHRQRQLRRQLPQHRRHSTRSLCLGAVAERCLPARVGSPEQLRGRSPGMQRHGWV
eukprot:scaffold938_cov334-Pavlova_lutheri.AAC.6